MGSKHCKPIEVWTAWETWLKNKTSFGHVPRGYLDQVYITHTHTHTHTHRGNIQRSTAHVMIEDMKLIHKLLPLFS